MAVGVGQVGQLVEDVPDADGEGVAQRFALDVPGDGAGALAREFAAIGVVADGRDHVVVDHQVKFHRIAARPGVPGAGGRVRHLPPEFVFHVLDLTRLLPIRRAATSRRCRSERNVICPAL
jgi:hypothetical protein